jgi:hypothetical protein
MLHALLNSLFGCSHQHTTFPQTRTRKKETYVVCLDCGKEFSYNWQEMRIGQPVPALAPVVQAQAAPVVQAQPSFR